MIERGQQRFNIYCSPCHDRLGNGDGMIVRRGYRKPPSYHIDRLRQVPNGYILRRDHQRIRRHAGLCGADSPRDRWAIVAYVRALQLSQNASINDVPADARGSSSGRREASNDGARLWISRLAELARDLRQWRTRALIVGVIGAVLLVVGLIHQPVSVLPLVSLGVQFLCRAWRSGSLAWLMLQYLTGGAWGVVIRRPAEAAARTLPLVALMFLPIVIGIPNLYEWSHADKVEGRRDSAAQAAVSECPVLHRPRGGLFCGLDSAFVVDEPMVRAGGPRRRSGRAQKMAALGGPGMVFWGFSVTFMSIDWMLSLNPHWFSTMFGLLIIAGQGLSAMAFLITILVLFSAVGRCTQC